MNVRTQSWTRRGGFTLIELMVSVALLGLVVGNVYMVLADSSKAFGSQTKLADTEMQVRRTLDRIALAVMGASRGTLWTATEAPTPGDELNFELSLGLREGQAAYSDPQKIGLTTGEGQQVTWYERPGAADERKVVWARWVADFAKGEVPNNGLDDNGNGLIDEKGLSFDVDGNSVTIRVTLQRPGPGGTWITKDLETTVTCRN